MSVNKFKKYESGRILVWENEILETFEKTDPNWIVRAYDSIESTMDAAAELSKDCTENSPGLVIAREQTQGRGRQGRSWQPATSGFYATYCFVKNGDFSSLYSFPLVTACILSRILKEINCQVYVKWPNDLLCSEGKKISGVLIELLKDENKNSFLIGIGVNLRGEPSSQENSTSLHSLTGRQYTPVNIANFLSNKLFEAFKKASIEGFQPFMEEWLSLTSNLDQKLSVHVGTSIVTGIFKGVNKLGHLILDIDGFNKEISSGELISER
ncbi:MAG: biotin--[acetyl-CoA-carboxylase] ligase [bacterium]|nr:biotin--[acetyl-CoA-carboxylase] ligase [bacterium]